MGEMGEETTNKSKHIKSNQSESRSFTDDRYPCIWRCKFAWNLRSSISSNTATIWNQTKINSKQIKIVKKAINNTKTGTSSGTDVGVNLANNIWSFFQNCNIREAYGWSYSFTW